MPNRRRNLFILLFVFGLTAASAIVIATKPTVLGLDLKGGTQLVYQGEPTPQTPEVTPDAINRAIDIIRERTDRLGVAEPEIQRVGATELQVGLPNVQNAQRAIDQIGTTAQLHLYDLEGTIVPPPKKGIPRDPTTSPDPAPEQTYTLPNLYEAVQFAKNRKPECPQNQCTTNGPTYYLFDTKTHKLRAGPAERKQDLFLQFRSEKQPPGTQILSVPQGTVIVAAPANPSPSLSPQELASGPQFVLKDRPALSGTDIKNPEQNFSQPANQPDVTFEFTDAGRSAFQDVTRAIAERGRATAPPGTVNSAQADQYSQHFAIVLDNQLFSAPIINFVDNPDGIDGRTGAEIQGNFTISSAQDLAKILQIGALPIDLQLISQSTVSATLGQQALDQGLRAGVVGLIVVVL
jgi:SecD/SecF fusion protein